MEDIIECLSFARFSLCAFRYGARFRLDIRSPKIGLGWISDILKKV